ncbi:MAG: glycoside hydrolase family 2 protein [Ignavibacteriales bacterium]|nr:glycoside hydrolase family 2 protein [Ignavibacteriales bacterium]
MKIKYVIENNKFLNIILIFISVLTFSSCSVKENNNIPEWPKINNETKPWTRWWWHGSAVTKEGLTSNLETIEEAGLGGVEITPIYGVKGFEDKDISFLSTEWMEILSYTLQEGERLKLGVDLANASGWPFGGPWITADDACKNVKYKIFELKEGEKLKDKIEFIQEPLVRAVGHKVDISEVIFPISENKNLQELALDQVRFEKKIPLQTLIAYNQLNESIDLTDKVDENNILNWTASKGEWKIYAVFQGWHGKMVERAGKGGEGNVIDHFSESAAKKFLEVFDNNAKNISVNGLRTFFNDSYEVDDALGEADWTPLFFEEFEKLRGYNLKDYLPALFGNDTKEMNARVICDYRETISDLLLERFTKVWGNWAKKYGAGIRNQAHGSPANILDLYSASDIPETEGTNPMRIKMASSAGHVSGKPLIACEASTWLDEHFLSNLAQVKQNIDRYFVNGVNHIVYHGTPYSPKNEEWPGWMFYASVHFAPTNTWWEEFKTINSYVTNCQSFLQNSKPANDILVYFPIYDKWSEIGSSMLQHFGKPEEDLTKSLSEFLVNNGYTFDYISDRQILDLKTIDNKIISDDLEYKTIIIPNCNYIPLKTIEKIIDLAKKGATVILENNFPKDISGFNNLESKRKKYLSLQNNISFTENENHSISKINKGKIIKGAVDKYILSEVDVLPEELSENGIWFHKTKNLNGYNYFLTNWSEKDIDGWINFNSSSNDAVWFDPMLKSEGKAKIRNNSEVYVQLKKGETLILQWYDNSQDIDYYPIYHSSEEIIMLTGEWNIEFINGGPTIPQAYKTNELKSWTEKSDVLKGFSGTAKYTLVNDIPIADSHDYLIDLGDVKEIATIYLNDKKISTLVGPEFKTILKKEYLKKKNKLEIYVTNLMANRIIDLEKRGVKYKKFYNINFAAKKRENLDADGTFTAKNWMPLISGLLGPVKLIEVESEIN